MRGTVSVTTLRPPMVGPLFTAIVGATRRRGGTTTSAARIPCAATEAHTNTAAHVGQPLQPPVPAGLWRVAVRLPDDTVHRARGGAAASWRPQRHRGLFRGRLLVAGHLQHSLHRADRGAAQRLSAPRDARDGGDLVMRRGTGDETDQESRSADPWAAASVAPWTSPVTRASSRTTTRTPPWPSIATARRWVPVVLCLLRAGTG